MGRPDLVDPAGRPRRSPYTAVTATFDKEIQATTASQFATLLRLLQIRSGEHVSDIARRAGIARSQAYALIDLARTRLPTQLPQVTAFAEACGLPSDQVALVAGLWVRLQEPPIQSSPNEPPAPLPLPDPGPAAPTSEDRTPVLDHPRTLPGPRDTGTASLPTRDEPPDSSGTWIPPTPTASTRALMISHQVHRELSAAAGHRTTVRSPDLVAELVEEMKALRRGRGILEGRIEDRIGPALRVACGVPEGSSPTEVRRVVAHRLTDFADQLPDDLRNAVLAAFAMLPETRQRFYQERVRWVAGRMERDERTAQRRINEAFTHLAELAVATLTTRVDESFGELGPAWYTEKLRVSVALDQASTEAFEWRRVVSNRDGLAEVDLAFTLTQSPNLNGEPIDPTQTNIAMLYGGTLMPRETATARRLSFSIVLPRPLDRGERTEFALRFQAPEGQAIQPHYVCLPREQCKLFDLRVRFDRERLPRTVWQLARTFHSDLDNPAITGTKVELDAAGELHLRFEDLAPGFAYGARWEPSH